MWIIGCDFHPSWQQVSFFDPETGEIGERKLVNGDGEAERFYRGLPVPSLIGVEACGNSQWFVDLLQRLGHEVWIGDAAQIRASYVRRQKTDRRDAAHILQLLMEGRFPRLWTPSAEQRDLRQLLIHRHKLVEIRTRVKNGLQHLMLNRGVQKKNKLWSQAGQQALRELPLQGWSAQRRQDLLSLLASLNEQIGRLDQAAETAAGQHPQARLLMTAWCAITSLAFALTIGDATRFRRGKQVASYLGLIPREHSSGGRQKLGVISKQGNRFVRMLLVEAVQTVTRRDESFRKQYSAALPSHGKRRSQGGGSKKISRTTLLDDAHPDGISGDRSYREQPAGGPG